MTTVSRHLRDTRHRTLSNQGGERTGAQTPFDLTYPALKDNAISASAPLCHIQHRGDGSGCKSRVLLEGEGFWGVLFKGLVGRCGTGRGTTDIKIVSCGSCFLGRRRG